MKIDFIEIENFRKLKSCRLSFSEKQTLFVGANNSGKTSAMDALISFLKDKNRFKTKDITLSNWSQINEIGISWATHIEEEEPDLSLDKWHELMPKLDVWLQVKSNEIQYVSNLIPKLSWRGGLLGVRLVIEPKDIEKLYKDYRSSYQDAQKIKESAKSDLKLWPATIWDYLEKKGLISHFNVSAYLLDPDKIEKVDKGNAVLQKLSEDSTPIESNPFEGLIRIDIINAQRGFSDPNDTAQNYGSLSTQLREYFSKHLNPTDKPNVSDIKALETIESAKKIFDETLKESFNSSLTELEELNYPGFGNPNINISSEVKPIDSLNHKSAVQFGLMEDDSDKDNPISLPEIYNGLGYQNLISMVFKLIRYRDDWMKVGKIEAEDFNSLEEIKYEPLHLVLIEEPEAHLHAQVQQVFVRKAYDVLRFNENLRDDEGNDKEGFSTQLVISTHSNHIAHEIDFNSLRYFKRLPSQSKSEAPISVIINLSDTFGEDDETPKFAIRYLKTTHSDLFFADAVILVEGTAERVLLPHFIENHFPKLTSAYISILEIGGSHAHRLRPLIENLGIITLIITDLDSGQKGEKGKLKACVPKHGEDQETQNYTIKNWLPELQKVDELVDLGDDGKVSEDKLVRVAYQTWINLGSKKAPKKIIPYTFEDSLLYQNVEIFQKIDGVGLIKKFKDQLDLDDLETTSKEIFDSLRKGNKGDFALDLLFHQEPSELQVPDYISDGLSWVETSLSNTDFVEEAIKPEANDE
ncbi:AAA family ATPase [Gracilimonas sediminicola]|uniref:AAA family ATPase n=1 Tax=Gracilimonas sediminicola TaxID=2952158 RepID=A0A9X2L1N5_9BACT|nr:AAA family ATPase [Gracilimonas sediminicola]